MRKALAIALTFCLVYAPVLSYAATPGPLAAPGALAQDQQAQGNYQPFTPDQLDNLLGSIALYSDPLLAQVLPAATYPDQIDQAAQFVSANGPNGIDEQPWDISVKAVAHYPTILNMMASKPDWTTAIGQAYVNQSADVSASIQRLRHMAYQQRNLATTPQQEVTVNGPYIEIVPAQPQYIFVPTYDPAVVFFRPVGLAVAIGFGTGFLIGAWLNRGWGWGGPGIYYTGWRGGGWIGRSRGFVQVNNSVYVNERFRTVAVNRAVLNRSVNITNINRYNNVHNNVTFNNRTVNRTTNVSRANSYNSSRTVNRNAQVNRVNNYNSTANANRSGQSGTSSAPRSFSPPASPATHGGNATAGAGARRGQTGGQSNRNVSKSTSKGQKGQKPEDHPAH